MQINQSNNSPAFGSTVTVTKGLMKSIEKNSYVGVNDAYIKLINELKNDGKNRHYKFGHALVDNDEKSIWNINAHIFTFAKRLYVKVSENLIYRGYSAKLAATKQSARQSSAKVDYNILKNIVSEADNSFQSTKEKAVSIIDLKNVIKNAAVKSDPVPQGHYYQK